MEKKDIFSGGFYVARLNGHKIFAGVIQPFDAGNFDCLFFHYEDGSNKLESARVLPSSSFIRSVPLQEVPRPLVDALGKIVKITVT